MLEKDHEEWNGRPAANAHHDGPTAATWWMICRSGKGHVEAMTLPCVDGESLALFSYEEEAKLFLWSAAFDGLASGWRVRESRRGEVTSVLYDPCTNVKRVALDPTPAMVAEGTVTLVTVDRATFVVRPQTRGSQAGSRAGKRARKVRTRGVPSIRMEKLNPLVEPRLYSTPKQPQRPSTS